MIRGNTPGVGMVFFTQGGSQSHGHTHLSGSIHHPGVSQPDMGTTETAAGHKEVPYIRGIKRPVWDCIMIHPVIKGL